MEAMVNFIVDILSERGIVVGVIGFIGLMVEKKGGGRMS